MMAPERWQAVFPAEILKGGVGMLASSVPRNGRVEVHEKSKKRLAGRRILLAEDEGLIALELEEMLRDFGCDLVGPLARVDEVLENARHGRFDGALLDINLRGRQIFEILPELQKLGLPIVLTSGYNDVKFFPTMFRAIPRLAKPFNQKDLERTCERVFTNPAVR
jgi:DNA-binding LytR/AlgR family response regulator